MQWWAILLSCAGGISAIGGAAAVIGRTIKPVLQAGRRAALVDEQIRQLHAREGDDLRRFKALEQDNGAMLIALSAILNHLISGNSIEKLKSARDELERHIISCR